MVRISTDSVLFKALQQLSEADLTRVYLIPLFEAMGFMEVERLSEVPDTRIAAFTCALSRTAAITNLSPPFDSEGEFMHQRTSD